MHPDLICGLLLLATGIGNGKAYVERTCFHSHHVPVQCRLYSADTLLPVRLLFLYGVGVQLTEDALRNTTSTQSR